MAEDSTPPNDPVTEDGTPQGYVQPGWRVNTVTQVTGNQNNYYQSAATPLTSDQWLRYLIAYWEEVSQPDPLPENASRQIKALWRLPFYAHSPNDVEDSRLPLWKAIQENFKQDQRVRRIKSVVLLGEPGSGKTPALRFLRTIVAKKSLSLHKRYLTRKTKDPDTGFNFTTTVVPIYLRLADLKSGQTLLALIRDAFNAKIRAVGQLTLDQTAELLRTATCLLLLDGLEYLRSELHRGSTALLRQFMESHPDLQYIVTCSTSVYRDQLGRVDTLYLDYLTNEEAMQVLAEDYNALNQSLRRHIHNRSLLRLLLLDEFGFGLENKGQLVQNWVRRQIRESVNSSGVGDLDQEMIERLLEHLAYLLYRNHVRNYTEYELSQAVRSYLETWGEPYNWTVIVKTLRGNLLRRDEDRRWHFVDSMTASYCAASYIRYNPEALQTVFADKSNLWWREVLETLVGLVRTPSQLLFQLIDHDIRLAAHCAKSVGNILDSRVESALVDGLIEQMEKENAANRCFIIERLGESRHPRVAEALLATLHKEWSSVVIKQALRALAAWSQANPHMPLAQVEETVINMHTQRVDPITPVLEDGIAILLNPPDQRHAHESRLSILLLDKEQPRLCRGIAAIGLGFAGTDTARDTLLALFCQEQIDDFLGWCVTEALVETKDPLVTEQAKTIFTNKEFQSDDAQRHRARAIYLLGHTNFDKKINTLLVGSLRADKEDNVFVRGYAVQTMVQLDLPNTRQEIERLFERETSPWVLRKIAEALGQIGTPASIPVLEQHLFNDRAQTRWKVREAVEEIKIRYAL